MGFDTRAAEAVGLAAAVWVVVWLGLRFVWRKSEKPPGVSLQLFAASLGLWMGGSVFYADREWTGHIGALLILAGTVFGWVVFDRLARSRHEGVPAILRQLCGAIVVLVAAASFKMGIRAGAHRTAGNLGDSSSHPRLRDAGSALQCHRRIQHSRNRRIPGRRLAFDGGWRQARRGHRDQLALHPPRGQ